MAVNRRHWTAEQLITWARGIHKKLRRLPRARDLRPADGAPTYKTIALRFKTMRGFYDAANLPVPSIPSKQQFISRVRQVYLKKKRRPLLAEVLGRYPFTPHTMRRVGFSSYDRLLGAAQITPFRAHRMSRREAIAALQQLSAQKARPLTSIDIDCAPNLPSVSFYQKHFGSVRAALRAAKLQIGPGRHGRLWHLWEKHCVKVAQALYGKDRITAGRKMNCGIPDIQVPAHKLIIEAMASAYLATPKEKELTNYLSSGWAVQCWCIRQGVELRSPRLTYLYAPDIATKLRRRGLHRLSNMTSAFFRRSDSVRKLAGLHSKSDLKIMLRELAKALGRTPSRRDVLSASGYPHPETFSRCLGFGSFHRALGNAGLSIPHRYRRRTDQELQVLLRALSKQLQRTPTSEDVKSAEKFPALNTFIKRFGSFRNALVAAGVRPRLAVPN